MFDIQILDDGKKIEEAFATLGGPAAVRISRQSIRSGLGPMVKAAKRNVPVRSGNLRASLGTFVSKRTFKGLVRAKVWPRAKFQRTVGGVKQKSDISQDRAGHPRTYAYRIQWGRPKSSPVRGRRRAGPTYFLSRAYSSEKNQYAPLVSKAMWKGIKKAAIKQQKIVNIPEEA